MLHEPPLILELCLLQKDGSGSQASGLERQALTSAYFLLLIFTKHFVQRSVSAGSAIFNRAAASQCLELLELRLGDELGGSCSGRCRPKSVAAARPPSCLDSPALAAKSTSAAFLAVEGKTDVVSRPKTASRSKNLSGSSTRTSSTVSLPLMTVFCLRCGDKKSFWRCQPRLTFVGPRGVALCTKFVAHCE